MLQTTTIVFLILIIGSLAFLPHNIPGGIRHSRLFSTVLEEYLNECSSLGNVRFVVVGSGAILETVGSFENLRYADSPKGRLATVSTDIPCFECHIRLTEIQEIKHVVVEKFEKTLRVSRFIDKEGKTVLSAILHGDQHISNWDALKEKYGENMAVSNL